MAQQESGIVVATRGKFFEVRAGNGDHVLCEVRKKVKYETDSTTPVVVGDDVLITRTDNKNGAIEKVLERRKTFERPMVGVKAERKQVLAANIDRLAVVASVKQPDLKTGLIDRMLVAAHTGGMEPLVIINKIDLGQPEGFDHIVTAYRTVTCGVSVVSAIEGTGLDDLRQSLRNQRTMFAGHSGVGKSTLLNSLIPGLDLKTKEISSYSGRGRHVTANIELFELPGSGFVVDSPGLKVMGLWDVEPRDLPHYYPEFRDYETSCRFQPCTHVHEPGCAVQAAVEEKKIFPFRYENYVAIFEALKEESGDRFK
ncbi:MAG: ribosome small subunit-dependent GTPase A [Candidatus Zixiibacteriota bacterium]